VLKILRGAIFQKKPYFWPYFIKNETNMPRKDLHDDAVKIALEKEG
jgi:hypothetical protein